MMSVKGRKFSLDTSCPDKNGNFAGRRSSGIFSSKKFGRSQSLDGAEEEVQKLNRSFSFKVSLRDPTITEESLNKSDVLTKKQSVKKHNKIFHKLFEAIPEEESLTNSFTCALQKEVPYHGKLFISEYHVCFYSSVLLKDTKMVIPVSSVSKVKKQNSALSMLSIQTSSGEKYSFVSMRNREKCYELLESVTSHSQQEESPNSSPYFSSAENEADRLIRCSSSEDDVDKVSNSSDLISSEALSRCSSIQQDALIKEDLTNEPGILRNKEEVTPCSLFREMKDFGAPFYIYMILLLLLFLASGYIGLRITALEEQLNSLGALTDLASSYREYRQR